MSLVWIFFFELWVIYKFAPRRCQYAKILYFSFLRIFHWLNAFASSSKTYQCVRFEQTNKMTGNIFTVWDAVALWLRVWPWIERSGFEPWPTSLLCVLLQGTLGYRRVFIRSRVPGTGTRLLWTEYPATLSVKLKKRTARKKLSTLTKYELFSVNLKPLFCTYLSINCHQIVKRKLTSTRKALCDVAFVNCVSRSLSSWSVW